MVRHIVKYENMGGKGGGTKGGKRGKGGVKSGTVS